MTLAERLVRERKRRKISAEALSLSCGVSRSYITLIETGKRLPGAKVLPKLAAAFGVKTSKILDWYLEEVRSRLEREMAQGEQP